MCQTSKNLDIGSRAVEPKSTALVPDSNNEVQVKNQFEKGPQQTTYAAIIKEASYQYMSTTCPIDNETNMII
jgi:hypothetical protein